MLTLFNNRPTASQGIYIAPDWPYVKTGINKEIKKVIDYMQSSAAATKSNHFLVRLLQSISVPMGIDTERYYANVDVMALNLSMALGMTSSIYKGKFFQNVFYGDNSREILIATDTSFDFQSVHDNWENVKAVEVIQHNLSDLSLNLPDGKNNWNTDVFAVTIINIPMLAVQYRAFRLQEKYYYDLTGESPRSVMQFLARYVIPNMLVSHMDQVIVNRLNNLLTNKAMSFPIHKLPFYITPYEQKLNKVHNEYIKILADRNRTINGMLEQIPMLSKDNLRHVSILPTIAPTMQVNWALMISRLNILKLLLDLSDKHRLSKSAGDIRELKRIVRNYRNNNLLESMLPNDLLIDANNIIERLEFMAET